MSWVDITLIGIVVLFGLFGVWKGVQKSALYLGTFLISFVVAFFLTNIVSEALLNLQGLRSFVMNPDLEAWSLYSWIYKGLSAGVDPASPSLVPTAATHFIGVNFYAPINEIMASSNYNSLMGEAVYLAFNMFSLMVGFVLFLFVRLLLCLITMIIKSYIPATKTAGMRVGGLFVGMVRGGIWAFVITLIFSVMGGFTFASGLNSIENEYENSVISTYFNQGAYAMKNKLFLPDSEMFGRIMIKFEENVTDDSGEQPETPPATNDITGDKAEIYVDFMNFNYDQTMYSLDTQGSPTLGDNTREDLSNHSIKTDSYAYKEGDVSFGFDSVVDAILDYNVDAAESIYEQSLDTATPEQLARYKLVLQGVTDQETQPVVEHSLYELSNSLIVNLNNYMNEIENARALTDPNAIATQNTKLREKYDAITATLDEMKACYDEFGLIKEKIGGIQMGDYPDCYQREVPSLEL